MGIYSGSVAFTRYKVVGKQSKNTLAALSKLLTAHVAAPIRVDGPAKPENIGWVRPLLATDEATPGEDSHWDMSDCYLGEDFLMRVRYDRRKIPSSLVQMLYKQKLRDHLIKSGKNMPRSEREQVKTDLMADLLKRTLPMLQFTDLLWRESAGELYIFSSSKSVTQRIELLFYQTFGTKLDLSLIKSDQSLAYLNGQQGDQDDSETFAKRLAHLSVIEPSVFAAAVTH